jgi:hypothetical protein
LSKLRCLPFSPDISLYWRVKNEEPGKYLPANVRFD